MILVAFDAHAARGFNAPKIIKIGSVEQKDIPKKPRGVLLIMIHTLHGAAKYFSTLYSTIECFYWVPSL